VTTTAPTRPRPINRPFPTRESTRGSLLGRLLRATEATLAIAALSVTVWAHHMFTEPAPPLTPCSEQGSELIAAVRVGLAVVW
jgi:hypothetical protein